MLSRLSYAAQVCDEAIAQYDLTTATTACYNLWLYDLCDVYLVRSLSKINLSIDDLILIKIGIFFFIPQEYLKPVFQSGSEESKSTAQRVLFKSLDVGLRLLSPFMPFITEELYQRLPYAELPYPSICVSPYPDSTEV